MRPLLSRLDLLGLLGRPAIVAALAILAVCVPTSEQNASAAVTVTPADLGCVVLVGMAGLRLLRGGWPPRSRLWVGFGMAALGFAVTTVTAQDPSASLPGLVRYLEIFVAVPIAVVIVVRDRIDLTIVCGALLGAGVIEGAVGVWQYAAGTGASFGGQDIRAVGTFGALEVMGLATVVGYSIVVALGLALALRGRARAGMLLLAGLLSVPLLLSLSRGALIATVAAALVMVVVTSVRLAVRTLVFGGAAAAVVIIGLTPSTPGYASSGVPARLASIVAATDAPDRSVQDRYDLWQTALTIWREHPYTGVGLKQFAAFRDSNAPISLSSGSDVADASTSLRREPLLSPHNMYLLVLSEQGILGAAAFGGLLLGLGVRAVRRTRHRATAELPHDNATSPIGIAAVGIIAWTLVNFAFGDIGGPTTVLLSILLGLVAWWAVPELSPEPGQAR
jgi:hypothetical protein